MTVVNVLGVRHEAEVKDHTVKVGSRVLTPQQFLDLGFTIEDCTEEEQSALEKLGIHEQCAK